MVAYKLQEKLRTIGFCAEIVRVPYMFFPEMLYQSDARPSLLRKIAVAALRPADVWLNFAETSLRPLDYDVIVTLHWNTLYLRHPNILAYFLSHDKSAYDLYEYFTKDLNTLAKVAFSANAKSRRLVDKDIISRIRTGKISLLAISRNVATRLETYWHVRPHRIVYPGGYDPVFYDDSRDYVLYFGRLDWLQKRISLVYSTARMLPEIPFVVAGGPVHRHVDPRVLNPPKNVRLELFNQLCPLDKKTKIYSQASCVLYPSVNEDFGIVPVEAMSAGKPCVVCTDGGGVTETVVHERTGLIAPATPGALAAAVERLHRHGQSMRQDCRERAKFFSWERCVDGLCSEIRRSLDA